MKNALHLNSRDREYIENRLSAPAVEVTEAIGRLRQVGEHEAAGKLLVALQTFTDECRQLKYDLFYPGTVVKHFTEPDEETPADLDEHDSWRM